MARIIRFSGILGLVLISFGLLGGLVAGSFSQWLLIAHFVLGAVFLAISLITGASRGGVAAAGEALRGRRAQFGLIFSVYTIFFIGLLVGINWLAAKKDTRWDLTAEGVHSLAPQSVSVLKSLKKELLLVSLVESPQVKDLLELYRFNQPLVKVSYLNPQAQPQLLEKYQMKSGNVLYLQYGDGAEMQVSRLNDISEDLVTNTLLKLSRGEARKVYYLSGHHEPGLNDQSAQGLAALNQAVSDEHLKLEPLLLAQLAAVPADAAAVIVVAPEQQIAASEINALTNYVEQGGSLLLFADPRGSSQVRDLAAHFGITVGDDVVVDQVNRLFAGPTLGVDPLVREYAAHPITKDFNEQTLTIFSVASSVNPEAGKDGKDGVRYTTLAKSGEASWAEKNMTAIFDTDPPTAAFDPGDVRGPIALAVAYEKDLPSNEKDEGKETNTPSFTKHARVVVFGDSDWIRSGRLNQYSHRDFVLNTIGWLSGEEGGVTIRPRAMKSSLQPVPHATVISLLAGSLLVPELVLLFGLFVWWSRKNALA